MCGIHLIWGKDANPEAIEAMVADSYHRGPDQQDVFSPWPGLWIGVNRLKILHPGPDADQPFWAPDGNSLLIWNGEIYNFLELKKLLSQMGVEFLTESDTEVLLHYLRFFGLDALKNLEGMFSLIYVNLVDQSVVVARDRTGEKPLYFSQTPDTFALSSETRGLARLTHAELEVHQIEPYFYLRSPIPEKTFFRGIRPWKPGRFSKISQHSTFRWDTLPDPEPPRNPPSQESFIDSLRQAVLRQFHADVPHGVMLSGGADSSLLYSLWYKETGIPLPAYTIEVEKKYRKKYADATFAKQLVRQVPAEHQLVEVTQQVFLDRWEDYLQSVDQPIGDSAGFLTWLIGLKAKNQVKVLASGAGADELWGGYQRHQAFYQYLKYPDLWGRIAPTLANLPFGRTWKKFMQGIDSDPRVTFMNFAALQNPPKELLEDYLRIFDTNLSPYKQALDFDRKVYLVQDVLKVQDNALMAHGIEGRSPYLDSSMISMWRSVEDQKSLLGKPWIKQGLEDLNLSWISSRRKFGFGLPLPEWLSENGPFAQRVFSSLREFAPIAEKEGSTELADFCKNPEKQVNAHFLTLYNLFLLAEWMKLHRA
ncbi:asparagine synthase (glutamine-hydrolyzing) [Algoriphagus taiwanensis]|uniref:asparagine synthase (glutamine-hydrolyzing) n=1 Tax=Algoriphagus taiwanensis TaxID=1445656 RepID=A0ABQ6Q4R7_9BACT|nr:asparagine synthase (glutamine-hydrolyzing) [Algoriphagus taiwanensis]